MEQIGSLPVICWTCLDLKPCKKIAMKLSVAGLPACAWLLRSALLGLLVGSSQAQANDATSLRERHAALREQLASNQFKRPLYLESSEGSGELKGDIYARIEQPYAVVGPALQGMDHWCDILILHQNVKGCRASNSKIGDTLSLHIGRKFDQPLADAHLVNFHYAVKAFTRDYLQVALHADQGPLGTSRYHIMLEVVELDARHVFLHLSYSYTSSMTSRAAAQTYLSTIGRNKVGFSIVGRKADGQPIYRGGMRGVIERNTMRYYLAIEAYLGALSVPAPERLEKRLNDWHAGVERYPLQLRELGRDEYLAMKRKEIRRQRAPATSTPDKH
jgi:hypothetical protein